MLIIGKLREVSQRDKTDGKGNITGAKFSALLEVSEPLDLVRVSLGSNQGIVSAARGLVEQTILIPVSTSVFEGKAYLRAEGEPRKAAPSASIKAA